jgi:ubiquinone/menaquinone biosynthesis C-methylase UbiE
MDSKRHMSCVIWRVLMHTVRTSHVQVSLLGCAMKDLTSEIREDFDCIALLPEGRWGHNSHYHDFLLKHIPTRCENTLEIGCGTGKFARLLAERSEHVLALDLSPNMIRIARERSKGCPNIEFQVADVMTWEFPTDHFDCIVCIATMHHLPLGEMLAKMKQALKAGGTLVILDLFRAGGLCDCILTGSLAMPASFALRLIKNGRIRASEESRQAWTQHGERDSYLTVPDVRRICESALPGARVRKHLFWRYSIVWKRLEGLGVEF